MSIDPLKVLRDVMERITLKASGIPWNGRKTPAPYMAYFPNISGGIATLRGGRRYQARVDGWRVMNKPQSRRARHRQNVAFRKAGRA
jgi:hypothetical protein